MVATEAHTDLMNRHPLALVRKILEPLDCEEVFIEFSQYRYVPQSVADERLIFKTPISNLSWDWVSELLNDLQDGEELAFHSCVVFPDGKLKHIRMVDFDTGELGPQELSLMQNVLGEAAMKKLHLFSSGRSFHGYFEGLVSQSEWVEFMGRLLLLNMPNQRNIIDTRWVGHRLIAGYASLRWSCNSAHYLALPHVIEHEHNA